jgi:4-azaleucine resistance transporter AzlC
LAWVTDPRFVAGARVAIPFAVASAMLGVAFGVASEEAGLSPFGAIAMSVIVYSGASQIAAAAVLTQGGTVIAAALALTLMNSRFLPMGVSLARWLPGRPLSRIVQAQAINDTSWALAARPDGTFDRLVLFGASAIQYVAWCAGTVIGALAGHATGDPAAIGLDAVYPTFFVILLMAELRNRRAFGAAALGALIALALVPFAPAGVPILAATLATSIGLWLPRGVRAAEVTR